MADNKVADAGSGGATFATIETSFSGDTANFPANALVGASGSEGSWTVGVINGDATNGLDVDVTRVGGTVTIQEASALDVSAATVTVAGTGTFAAQIDGAALTALQLIDDSVFADDAAFTLASSKVTMAGAIRDDALSTLTAIEGDAVPLRVGSTGALWVTDTNSAAILADTANMDTNLGTVAGAVSGGQMQVDVVAALPAGTNAIGKLAANSGVDIGDVDVTSLDGVTSEGSALGNGILIQGDDGTDRKNINVDATTGDVQVDVTNTVTVSGTVTANLGATDNAVLDDIAAKLAPHTTNGVTPYLNQDTSAIATVKSGAGTIYWIACMSTDATPVYLNLYDSTTATLGSTTPTNQFIVPSQGDANGAGFTINFGPFGIQYSTGIQVAAATTFNGSTDPGTNVVITNIGYE